MNIGAVKTWHLFCREDASKTLSMSCELTSECRSNHSTCLFCSDVLALTRNVALDSYYVTGNTWL